MISESILCKKCEKIFNSEIGYATHECQPSPQQEPSVKQCQCKMIHCEVCGNQVSATEGLLDKLAALQSQLLKAEAKLKASEERAGRLVSAAEFALMTIEHALALGYLGEGSTNGMAKEAVVKLETALALDAKQGDVNE